MITTHSDPPALEAWTAWPGEVREADPFRLFVRAHGTGEPAVFVHGLGGSSTNWTDLMGLLGDRLSTLAPDLPGHGRSPASPTGKYGIGTHVRAVIALIEATGRGPVHLVGNSLGGATATLVASRRPDLVRSLALVSPAFPQLNPRRAKDLRMLPLLVPGAAKLADRMMSQVSPSDRVRGVLELCYADPSRITDERMAEAVADARRHAEDDWAIEAFVASARGLIASYLLPGGRSLWSAARRVTAPVQLVWGAQDKLVPVETAGKVLEAFGQAAGGARLEVYPDAGHVAMMEKPRETAGLVRALLDRVGGWRMARVDGSADLTAAVAALRAELAEVRSTLQDVHDGLAGVRTDLTALPEQLGPVVTSAVARALANQAGGGVGDLATQLSEVEARLAGHVDEAVLALAEAVLRRPDTDASAPQGQSTADSVSTDDEVQWDDDGPQDWELEESAEPAPDESPIPSPDPPVAERIGQPAADVLPAPPPDRTPRKSLFRRR